MPAVSERKLVRLEASLRRSLQFPRPGGQVRSAWKLRRRAAAWLMVLVARTITTKSVRFVEGIDDARQRIYFANHTSHLDFILIWSSLPRHVRERARPVARRDYWERSRFRRYYVRKVFNAVRCSTATKSAALSTDVAELPSSRCWRDSATSTR